MVTTCPALTKLATHCFPIFKQLESEKMVAAFGIPYAFPQRKDLFLISAQVKKLNFLKDTEYII